MIVFKGGQCYVLIIEEVYDLMIFVMKYFKCFWEFEDGFLKLLGILLVGQIELFYCFDECCYYEFCEFI